MKPQTKPLQHRRRRQTPSQTFEQLSMSIELSPMSIELSPMSIELSPMSIELPTVLEHFDLEH